VTISIETLSHGCVDCGQPFQIADRICSIYRAGEVRSFETQIELGVIGGGVRNYWIHLYCHNHKLKEHGLKPDIHHCVECRKGLAKDDLVIPIFQVTNPRAINPLDPTDVGISLAERVYFIHGNCRNIAMNKQSTNPLHRG